MEEPNRRIIQTELGPEAEGLRLDWFLQKRFTYRSRSAWQTSIRNGEIKLNGRTTRASRILHAGELLRFDFPETEEPEIDPSYGILSETEEYLAVNKSGQIPVHPSGRFYNHTLLMILKDRYGELFPVNRLDRETSGITLFAKKNIYAAKLAELFASRRTEKRYIAFVHGSFPLEGLRANGWLSQDPTSEVRKKRRFTFQKCGDDDETTSTEFNFLKSNGALTMVEAVPETGRLHQIRATLCSLGYPLAGDKLYGKDDRFYLRYIESTLTDEDRESLLLERQALHAASLSFVCPFTKCDIFLQAPLPNDLQMLQDRIQGV